MTIGSDAGVSKLLQTETTFGMLGQCDNFAGAPKLVGIKGEVSAFVQDLAHGTGAAYAEALKRTTTPSACAQQFRMPVRKVTTDKGSANFVCERSLMKDRGDQWAHLGMTCDVHIASGCHTKTSALVQDDISGLLHCALGLHLSGNMLTFRKCIIADVRERTRFLHGAPPQAAIDYRRYVLGLFLARGPDSRARRAALPVYLSGDWRNREQVEYYFQTVGVDDAIDRYVLSHMIGIGVAKTLANRQISLYPRHRWTGFDLSLDQLGLMEATHGILGSSFRLFCATFAPPPRNTSVAFVSAGSGTQALALEDEPQRDEGGEEGPPRAVEAAASVGLAVAATIAGETWAEQNERRRAKASAFLSRRPLGRIIILREVFEPFRILLNRLIRMSSDSWETQEAAKEAQHLLGQPSQERRFRVHIAAKQELENAFMDAVVKMGVPERWAHLPIDHWDMHTRGLVFRLLSRALCVVEVLLRLPHDVFPVKLFLAMGDPEVGAVLAESDPCALGDFSQDFVSKFGLVDVEAQAALRFLAWMVYLDIVQIEQRHAALRKRVKVMAPTNVPQSKDVSAHLTVRQLRLRQQAKRSASASDAASPLKRKGRGDPSNSRRLKFAGGAWRAYIHLRARGRRGKANFRVMAAEYRALSAGEKAHLAQLGRLATRSRLAKSSGQTSFGPTSLQAKRMAQKSLREHQAQRQSSQSAQLSETGLIANTLAITQSSVTKIEQLARLARSESRREGALGRLQVATNEERIRAYESSIGSDSLRSLVDASPQLSGLGCDLRPWPDREIALFRWAPDTTRDVTKALSYATKHAKASNVMNALTLDWEKKTGVLEPREDRDEEDEGEGQNKNKKYKPPNVGDGGSACAATKAKSSGAWRPSS